MKKILLLFVTLWAINASAQDVIVKKDGSTIVSKVLEITSTEVKYKKFTNQSGPMYTIPKTEISVINYENGEKEQFEELKPIGTKQPTQPQQQYTTPSNVRNLNTPQVNDSELLKMAGVEELNLQKAKRLKKAGWIGGGILMGLGVVMTCWELIFEQELHFDDDYTYSYILGAIGIAGGVATTTACLVRAHKLEQRSVFSVQSSPLFQHDFALRNGTSLSTGLDMLKDNRLHSQTIGMGLRYNF